MVGESGEGMELSRTRCEICGKEKEALFRASHKERGKIRICSECKEREEKDLLPLCGCSC